MKVACIQLSSGENYNKNFKDIIKYIYKAISNNADLIITPETSSLISSNKKYLQKYTFEVKKDPLIKKIKYIAKKNKKFILLGSIVVKDKKKLKNRSIVIDQRGKIIAQYDKINMFDVKISKKRNISRVKFIKQETN